MFGIRSAGAIALVVLSVGSAAAAEDARIDYIALVNPVTLEPVDVIGGPTLAALAVRIENTRLIDNCVLETRVGRGQRKEGRGQ